jgi:non-ribosomal peptide synthetase component E (peptide arylation enzyme)
VTGRLEDVSAKEVEDVLFLHPAIADAAAIPLPDDDVAAHCTVHGLARQKIPERLEVVDALPRNVIGKVLKQELVSRYR